MKSKRIKVRNKYAIDAHFRKAGAFSLEKPEKEKQAIREEIEKELEDIEKVIDENTKEK